jgi:hypothetical protein
MQHKIADRALIFISSDGLPDLCYRPSGGLPPGKMAALHMTPDSPVAQLERAEDGAECDPDQEEEEEKGKEGEEVEEEEEEIVVEEEEEEEEAVVQEVAEVEVEANLEEEEEEDNDDVEEVLAEEQSPGLGTQEQGSHGGDAKSLVLQGKGKQTKKWSQPLGRKKRCWCWGRPGWGEV